MREATRTAINLFKLNIYNLKYFNKTAPIHNSKTNINVDNNNNNKSDLPLPSSNKNSNNNKKPDLPKPPIETYANSLDAKTVAATKYKGHAIIYIWFNIITGQYYVGSSYGQSRLEDYFKIWYLNKKWVICKSITNYGHINHMLFIMEDLGSTTTITKKELFALEQFYIDWNFKNNKELCLNRHPVAGGGNVLISRRVGKNNPMFGKDKSREFIFQQQRNKKGINNPQWGKIKSPETLQKLRKKVYVYDAITNELLFPPFLATVECKKKLKIGYDTLMKNIKNGTIYKGMIFSRIPLDLSHFYSVDTLNKNKEFK